MTVSEAEQKISSKDPVKTSYMEELHQEFTSLTYLHACFCDALAGVLVEGRVLDATTVEGLIRCAHWLQRRMDELRVRMEGQQKLGSDPDRSPQNYA